MKPQSNPPLWRWQELCLALGLPGTTGPDITGISIDSRTLKPGDLFIALSGDPGPGFSSSNVSTRDGHEFVPAAAAAGAVAVMVTGPVAQDLPQLRVDDTLQGLWSLARASVRRHRGRRIAVTGSSGKTTAKEFLRQLLDGYASPASLNNVWGVPLSLARMPADSAFGIFEVGMSQPGEILPLSRLIEPHGALVLNAGNAHIGAFDSADGVRNEKLSMARALGDGGYLVLHDQLRPWLRHQVESLSFGFEDESDARILSVDGTKMRLRLNGESLPVRLPGPGLHIALTSAACLALAVREGHRPAAALKVLAGLQLPAGRGSIRRIGAVTVIDDSYNANPASMIYALESLAARPGRTLAIIGDMLELGEHSDDLHRTLLRALAPLHQVILVGPQMSALAPHLNPGQLLMSAPEVRQIDMETLLAAVQPPLNVLVKGSNRVFWQTGFVERLCTALGASGADGVPDSTPSR